MLTIVPWYLAMGGWEQAGSIERQLRMLRVFRLLTIDKHISTTSVIVSVVHKNRHALLVALFLMKTLWTFTTATLWITEKYNDIEPAEGIPQRVRYEDIPDGNVLLKFILVY